MITSLRFNAPVSVQVGNTGKFKFDSCKEVFSIKDIPALRYNFSKYDYEDIAFIKMMMKQFKHSVNVVEMDIHIADAAYRNVHEEISNIAYIVKIDITNEHANSHTFSPEEKRLLIGLKSLPVDRIVMVDKSDCLDYMGMAALTSEITSCSGINKKLIGLCSSPFTTSENSCMSAALAREWSAKYNKDGEGALPSANHNSDSNNCGCLRYMTVASHIEAVNSERGLKGNMNEPSDGAEKKEKAPKEKKASVAKKGIPDWF